MEVFTAILSFLGEISWPLSVFCMFFLALHAIKENWLSSFRAWHNESGFEVHGLTESLIKKVKEKTSLNESEANQLRHDFKKAIDSANFLETGENANGKYWYSVSGMRAAQVEINLDGSITEIYQVFPCSFKSLCLQVTFISDIQPKIKSISSTAVQLEVPLGYKGKMTMNIIGP